MVKHFKEEEKQSAEVFFFPLHTRTIKLNKKDNVIFAGSV